MEREFSKLGVPVVILGCRPGFQLSTLTTLIRWLRMHRPAVLHTHLYSADTFGRLAGWMTRTPVIVSTRHNARVWSGRLRRVLYAGLAHCSTRVIACGEEVARHLAEEDGVPMRKILTIPNGVNLRRLDDADPDILRVELGIERDVPVLGVVGRLHPQKGHLDLLPVLRELASSGHQFVCLFAGEGELRPQIAASIADLQLGESVRLLGLRRDIGSFLAGIDVFVMPSRWEGLPMALLEAMAIGTACVCTSVGSIPSVITNGSDGLLVDPDRPSELLDALRSLLVDPDTRAMLGRNARETVIRRFNAREVAGRYEQLYRQHLGSVQALPAG